MKKSRFLPLLFTIFLVFSISVNHSIKEAYACSCVAPDSPQEELQEFDAVFSGMVTRIEEKNPNADIVFSADPVFVTFDVNTVWKGLQSDTITIQTALMSASCGFNFEDNLEYVVYANEYAQGLEVSLCSRTSLIADAVQDINELGTGHKMISDSKSPSSVLLPPLKQMKMVNDLHEIVCKGEQQLVFKKDVWLPACVYEDSIPKLIERGWADTHDPAHMDMNMMPMVPNDNDDTTKAKPPPITADNVIDANNQFAVNFYSDIASTNQNANIFFSPWSISTAAAIVYEGARENTADEMASVFGFAEDDHIRQEGFKSANDNLNENNSKYDLSVANALWLAQGFVPHAEYVNIAQDYYDSQVSTVDFGSNGIDIINKWVSENTQEKITELFPPGSRPDILLAITNAVYFKGTWVTQFDPAKTQDDGQFWIDSDESVTVPMMFLDESKLRVAYNQHERILELPYEGDKLSMMIVVPEQRDGLVDIEKSLSAESISKWRNQLQESSTAVLMPKVKLETEYNLIGPLKNLGMNDAFGSADFSGISENGLYISDAIHKAFVDINEEGTEAAAVTGFTLRESLSVPFTVDHPFIFLIQDNDTGNILFIGRMINPSL